MIFIQLTGLSGAGKSTLSHAVRELLLKDNFKVEIIDGDEYRKNVCKDLGFSEEDRKTNIRRLSFIGDRFVKNDVVAILAAINPYESIRKEVREKYTNVRTVWLKCDVKLLMDRDVKGLYKKSLLPDGHPEKIYNMTGVNDVYEAPEFPDLIINTIVEPVEISIKVLYNYIIQEVALLGKKPISSDKYYSVN